ncbi:IQ motif and SEC7 domain-containing protein 1 isoform X5 [Procambarus clarkii]|uniref:IQ motif and SEC7 domain-containing protein 1 isoform X5 n=1 Tax=Procambarus clarkii TaxID=6728 RepID=UPI0037428E7F
MHVPPGVQPCPSCYAYCVPRPPGPSGASPGALPGPGAPPVPRHAHPQVLQQQQQQQQQQRDSPGNSPHHSPHRTQPRPIHQPPTCSQHHPPFPDNRFGSLPHSQPVPKVPPHYNSLPHHQPQPPPLPPHHGSGGPPTHHHIECDPPPPPPHGGVPPGRPHVTPGPRPQHHCQPPTQPPPPPPPPHSAYHCQPHRCPPPTSHPHSQPYYGNIQNYLPPHIQSPHPPQQHPHPQHQHPQHLPPPHPQHPPPQLHPPQPPPTFYGSGPPHQANGNCGHPGQGNPPPAQTTTVYASCYGHLPPPRPPPLPPPLPPPQPFQQQRYGCLPHQHLVPPPPLALQQQQQQQQHQQHLLQQQHHHYHQPQQLYGCLHHIIELPGAGSPVKSDRPYSGKGVPSRGFGTGITKSYSVESSAPPVPPHHLHHLHHHHNATHSIRRSQLQQAVSQSSGVGTSGRRQVPRGTAADDSGNRNSRWRGSGAQGNTQGYELSQDFADMRLEMLERRYGGVVARRAAITIQRAYRRYAMYKKFRSITATAKAQEKRLSRRFTVDVPEWSDSSGQQYHDTEHLIRSEFDQLHRNLSATVYGEGRRPARSLSMRDTPRTTVSVTASSTRQQQDPYDLHDALASMNDSSLYCHVSAQSPLTPTSTATPAPTHVRNGSGDYQGQQNDRDLKYFSSEDSGLGSQDGIGLNRIGVCGRRTMRGKKVPPEVPRRTSSIKSCESSGSNDRSVDNGSLSSVQSSGSDSSLSQSASDRATPLSTHDPVDNADYHPTSPIWKRKNQQMSTSDVICDDKRLSQISENSEDSLQSHSSEGMTYSQTMPSQTPHSARYAHAQYTHTPHMPKVPEVVRKRQYRVGLNLFNKKPERGVTYLIGRGFLENSPQAVAKFLLTRKGLSKQMIGEYLGNLQNNFNMAVLECFAHDIDLSGMQVDVALRKFQTHFRMPGEAQKIERLMQVFAQRYCQCNRDIVAKLRDPETIFVLAFAIIMLNTDLHTASMKQEKRMKIDDFVKNLRGIDDGYDIEREMLEGMYQRIKSQEFRPGHDHVTQVLKVQQTMVGKKPNLALPHRRLVCYCRLYEIPDISKKERVGVHQREVFLFNDLLVVTKIFSKKKSSVTYTFRQSFPLAGLAVSTKEVAHYPYLMEIRHRVDNKVLIIFNARNEHDRSKFCEDLKESVCEMDEMESLRIEGELERQKASLRASRPSSTAENRDSGVADMELLTTNEKNGTLKPDSTLKRSALSNSLLDIHEAVH